MEAESHLILRRKSKNLCENYSEFRMKESSSSFLDREKKGSQNKSMGGDAKNLLFYTTDGSNRIKNSSSAR